MLDGKTREMSAKPVSISNVQLARSNGYHELSANVDGEIIWYRLPIELNLVPRPEAFIAPALLEAMIRGVPVELEAGLKISKKLLASLSDVQAILNCWNKDLNIVPIHAESSDDDSSSGIIACCFSGGIDSSYTYACYRDSITHLLLVQGFASGRGGQNDWSENIDARRAFADSESKSLIEVHSNVTKFLSDREISILLAHGALLGGLAAGLGLKQLLIPASYTFSELMPWGSHPLLDPLWGTEALTVIHHGADKTRTEKTANVAKFQYLLDQLQVCWFAGGRNCGTCGKCVRTALALHLLGVKAKSLTPYERIQQLEPLKSVNAQGFPFLTDLVEMANAADEPAIAKRLRGYLRNYRFRQTASDFVREIVGTRGRDFIRKLRPHAWHDARGSITSIKTS